MFVKERMTKQPVTVGAKEPVTLAVRLMVEKNIRHLIVLDHGKVVGVLSYADIMHVLPTTIDSLEQGHGDQTIRKTKIKDILPAHQRVITCTAGTCLEEAALIMRSYKIGSLPVVDDDGVMIGLITRTDIFDAFIDVLGVRSAGVRLNIRAEDKPGRLADIAAIIKSFGANITRMAVLPADKGYSTIMVRLKTNSIEPLKEALRMHGYQVESAADYRKKLSDENAREKKALPTD